MAMNQRRDRAVRTSLWRLQLNATTGMTALCSAHRRV